MNEHKILQTQRNDVLLSIQSTGLEPAEFEWVRVRSDQTLNLTVARLFHVPSESFFHFDLRNAKHWCRYSPGDETSVEEQYPGDWPTQLYYVRKWLGYLRRELEAPDLWASVIAIGTMERGAAGPGVDANAPFTPEERGRVAAGLNEIRAYLRATEQLDPARIEFVEERLRYLEGASGRLGRKDWLNLAFGAVVNIVVGVALAPDAARDLLRVVGSTFVWVFGGMPLLPNIAQ